MTKTKENDIICSNKRGNMGIRLNKKDIYTDKQINDTKIVLLSDVHFRNDKYIKRIYNLLNLLKEIKPDLICIPGDFADTLDSIITSEDQYLDILKRLSLICKTIMSFGVHDYHTTLNNKDEELKKYFEKLELVSNYFYPLFPNVNKVLEMDNNLMITGYSLPLSESGDLENNASLLPNIKSYIQNIDLSEKNYNIMLCHSPISFFNEQGLMSKSDMGINKLNLILSGHNHGGLAPKILEKYNRGIITPDKRLFPKNVSGLFENQDEGFAVLISRGFLKIPGSIKDEYKLLGTSIYNMNSILKPDVDILTLRKKDKSL